MKNKIKLFPIFYGVFLASFLSFSILDTLVIPRQAQHVNFSDMSNFFDDESSSFPSSSNDKPSTISSFVPPSSGVSGSTSDTSSFSSSSSIPTTSRPSSSISQDDKELLFSEEIIKTDELYVNNNVRIQLKTEVVDTKGITSEKPKKTTVFSAEIWVRHIRYLKTALAHDKYGINVKEKTSAMAIRNNAIFAINGDNYGGQEGGYVIRNGVTLRKEKRKPDESRLKPECLAIYTDGSFESYYESDISIDELEEKRAWQVFSFGPTLVRDNKRVVERQDDVAVTHTIGNQRAAIGIIEPLHYVIALCDGRFYSEKTQTGSYGMQLDEIANYMVSLGANLAYNLDGGGSATLFYDGEVINHPNTNGNDFKEREVSDIVYFEM